MGSTGYEQSSAEEESKFFHESKKVGLGMIENKIYLSFS
jgi:hypothetical protein